MVRDYIMVAGNVGGKGDHSPNGQQGEWKWKREPGIAFKAPCDGFLLAGPQSQSFQRPPKEYHQLGPKHLAHKSVGDICIQTIISI